MCSVGHSGIADEPITAGANSVGWVNGLIYLDHAATTPMRRVAIEAMLPVLDRHFANPSGSHRFARQARQRIDEARDVVASRCGWDPGGVVFTSGGTEADNAIIRGVVARQPGTAVCTAVEHHAVLAAVEGCATHRVVAVDHTGHVDLHALAEAVDHATAVVSVMAVNNEVGTITDLAAVAEVVRRLAPQAVLHTDAVQAAPWLSLTDIAAHVDAMSIAAHKFGGPKGVGALLVKPGVRWEPLIVGGGQERDRRSGTHNVAGIVAMAAALDEVQGQLATEVPRIAALRDALVRGVRAAVPDVVETVAPDRKVAGSAHLMVPGVENESLLFVLDEAEVCASAASACSAGAMEPSHVLAAMGVERGMAAGAVRLTLGAATTADEIGTAVERIAAAILRLRAATARGRHATSPEPAQVAR